jgi:hypothetical protein
LTEFEDRIPEPISHKLRFTAQEAANIVRNSATPIIASEAPDCEWLPWSLRRLFRRNNFLRKKENVNTGLRTIIEKRVQVEGMCSSALNRLVFVFQTMIILGLGSFFDVFSLLIKEIGRQNAKISQQHDMIRIQNAMLEQIMGAFRVTVSDVPDVPDEGDRSIPPSESEGFNVLNYNLCPPSQSDPPGSGTDSAV